MRKLRFNTETSQIPVISFSSTVSEEDGLPTAEDSEIVQRYMQEKALSEKSGGGEVSEIIPKFKGEQGVDVVPPRLIVALAGALLRQNFELSPSFQHLLYISKNQLSKIKKLSNL